MPDCFLRQIQVTVISVNWISRVALKGFPHTMIHRDTCATLTFPLADATSTSNLITPGVKWLKLCCVYGTHTAHCTLDTVFLFATCATEILFLWQSHFHNAHHRRIKENNFWRAFEETIRIYLLFGKLKTSELSLCKPWRLMEGEVGVYA
jgi:hypothetical protein